MHQIALEIDTDSIAVHTNNTVAVIGSYLYTPSVK